MVLRPEGHPQVAERVERLTYARLEAGVSYSLGRFEELRVERIEPHELHWDAKSRQAG